MKWKIFAVLGLYACLTGSYAAERTDEKFVLHSPLSDMSCEAIKGLEYG